MENQDTKPIPKIQFGDNKTDMEAFYDMKAFYSSLISEKTSPSSHVVSMKNTSPSEKTKTSIHTLKYLLSKDFSLLLQPGWSREMNDTLRYLLILEQNEGFCMTTKLEIQKLLLYFEQWSLEYHSASKLSATAEAELLKCSEVMNDLDANLKDFQELNMMEKFVCNELANMQEEKRKLEEKIKLINVHIANSTKRIDEIAKRKNELFQKGKMLKADRDDVRIPVTKMKAEKELAQRTQDIIEEEWSKLGEQFIRNTGFIDWM
jgi:hypothetical protein